MRTLTILILALSLILGSGLMPGAAPRAQTEFHPRLLFDDSMLAWLPDSIAADPDKDYVWGRIEYMGEIYSDVNPDIVLGSNYGSAAFPALGMLAHLGDEPLASEIWAKLAETTLYLVNLDGPMGSGDDLSAAVRLRSLLFAYDMIMVDSSSHDREMVLDEIRTYLEVMTTDFLFTRGIYSPYANNHSISIGAALVMADLCLRDDWPGDPLLDDARILGDQLIDKGMDEMMGNDGSFSEGGLYLVWVFRMLVPMWEARARIDGIESWDIDKVEACLDWTAFQLLPRADGYCLNRNDCSETSRPLCFHDTLWNWSQHRMADPRFARWVQDRITGSVGFNYGTFSDYPSAILYRHAGPMVTGAERLGNERFFPDQGLYAYRESWPGDPVIDSYHFTFQAGAFPGGHWQEDVGQFTLRAFGLPFAMDHGPGIPAAETEGHNLPLVNGIGQHNAGAGIGTDGSMEYITGKGFLRVLKADMQPAYTTHSPLNDPDVPVPGTDWSWGYDGGNPMERADRWVLLFPGETDELPTVYLLDDLNKDSTENFYQWRMHFSPTMNVSVSNDHYQLSHSEGSLDARLISPAPSEISWGQSSFDNGGPDMESKVLEVNHNADEAQFFWRMTTLPAGAPEPVHSADRIPGGVHSISGLAPDRIRHVMAAWSRAIGNIGFFLDGRFGVVELEDEGATVRSALIDGRILRLDDLLYASLDPKGWVVTDVDTVWVSDFDTNFQVYSPSASAVMAGETPVPFTRVGDYLVRGDWVANPESDVPGAAGWSLRASPGAPLRLALEGPGARHARLDIFDVRGRRLQRLLDGPVAAGPRELIWEGRDAEGRRQASGLYFARLAVDGQVLTARLLLLR